MPFKSPRQQAYMFANRETREIAVRWREKYGDAPRWKEYVKGRKCKVGVKKGEEGNKMVKRDKINGAITKSAIARAGKKIEIEGLKVRQYLGGVGTGYRAGLGDKRAVQRVFEERVRSIGREKPSIVLRRMEAGLELARHTPRVAAGAGLVGAGVVVDKRRRRKVDKIDNARRIIRKLISNMDNNLKKAKHRERYYGVRSIGDIRRRILKELSARDMFTNEDLIPPEIRAYLDSRLRHSKTKKEIKRDVMGGVRGARQREKIMRAIKRREVLEAKKEAKRAVIEL